MRAVCKIEGPFGTDFLDGVWRLLPHEGVKLCLGTQSLCDSVCNKPPIILEAGHGIGPDWAKTMFQI